MYDAWQVIEFLSNSSHFVKSYHLSDEQMSLEMLISIWLLLNVYVIYPLEQNLVATVLSLSGHLYPLNENTEFGRIQR